MSEKLDKVVEGLTDKTQEWLRGMYAIVAGVGLVGAALYACGKYSLLDVNPQLSEVMPDVLGKYLLLVVAFERAAAVFVGMFREQSRVDWSLRINRLTEILKQGTAQTAVLKQAHDREKLLLDELKGKQLILHVEDVPDVPSDADYVGYLTATKHAYEFKRAQFNSVSNRYVAWAVFVTGIVMATLGLSLFQEVLQLRDSVGPWQRGLLRCTDILVTGGLLGGGSAGLNAVLTKVDEFFKRG